MLSYRAKAVKEYVKQCHRMGKKPSVSEIADWHHYTCNEVRRLLSEIRNERNNVIKSFFDKVFGVPK